MCLLPLVLGICIADPANLTLRGDTSVQLAGSFTYHVDHRNYGGGLVGRAQIDMAVPLTKSWTLSYGIEHSSLLNTRSDRGQERVYLAIEWRPWGGK